MNGGRVVFRYKPMLGQLAPTATIGLCLNETWWRVDAYVDSGAAYSIVHGDFARDVGFDFERGERILVKVGDGSFCTAFHCKLDHTVSKREWVFPIISESVFTFSDGWMSSSISECASTSASER
jgi:hypothetical protein